MWKNFASHRMCVLACVLVVSLAANANAATILKLSLGSDSAFDLEYDGTDLTTVDDGSGVTNGEQDTAVEFLDFIAMPAIPSGASFTLSGVASSGPATVVGGGTVVLQDFSGGTLSLWDASNALLLSGTLSDSLLTGSLLVPVGAVFSTSFGTVTGGSLAPLLNPNSLSVSFSLSAVDNRGVAGFAVANDLLRPFRADGTATIAAVPEPAAVALLMLGSLLVAFIRRRR